MPIVKRTSVPKGDDALPQKKKLEITAGPKKDMPEANILVGELAATPQRLRRAGLLALDCNAPRPDTGFNVADVITTLRTPLDPNNTQEVRYRNRIRNRGTAITAMCITCVGTRKNVRECSDVHCPLWAFRFGSDPFYGKKRK